jgi:aminoglycoside/choline kinase family phosphotransferase
MSAISETTLSTEITEQAARCLNAKADAVVITRVTGDASTRAYFRASANQQSVIIALYGSPFDERISAIERLRMLEMDNPSARLSFASDAVAYLEATALFLEAGLPVPRILATSGVNHVVLIEDVGDARLQDWMQGRSIEEVKAAYARAMRLIVEIQEATKLATEAGSICSHLCFDEAKLKWELGFFFVNYVNKYLNLKLDAATSIAIQQDFKTLCAELAARPRVLTHRDYHTRNLMMKGDEMFIIDHQDARMGPASYDVASFLSDPYAAIDETIKEEMLDLFIALKADSSVPLGDPEAFRQELHLMTIQRMLKAIGTYAYQAAVMKNEIYVGYIAPAAQAALASMAALGRFDAVRALLEKANA